MFSYTASESNLLMACSSLQDASNDPNTGNSDEKLNEVPVTKNTLLDSLKNYINQNGLNIDDM